MCKFLLLSALFTASTLVYAGPGHDHGAADHNPPAAASSNAPKREPDGSVFLPKPSQRQLAIRTIKVAKTSEPMAFELPGRVIIDLATGGRVQALQAGRLQPGARGMPVPGQRVVRGEILAYVLPAVGALEAANQRASAAEIAANLATAQKRLARLKQLEGSVPKREIDEAAINVDSLQLRANAVSGSVNAREALVAPVSGVVASVSPNAIAGQVVDAREVLFEISDPNSVTIEAMAIDAIVANDIESGATNINGKSAPLKFIGASRSLREGQLPLMFRLVPAKNASKPPPDGHFGVIAIGETVRVSVQTKQKREGIAIPLSAIVKNPSNQDIVWVVDHAETYVPRVVRFTPLDGARVLVIEGVKADERVVVEGASLINQVR
jgi:membrane fusion protein, heavy metal efflux system